MKKKIKDYVNYEFRNVSKTKEVEDTIEEVTSNLFDMYDDLISKGYSEEEAYIKTVKNLGSFQNEFISLKKEEKYVIKPKWFDLLLVLSVITAVFALIIPFLDLIIGAIILLFSATFFGLSAYFMYESASFALNEKKDVTYHNYTLTKVLKFARINKFFWLIASTYIVSMTIARILVQLLTLNALTSAIEDPEQIFIIFKISVLVFIVIFIANFILFYVLYNKAYKKYYELTGELTFVRDKTKKPYYQIIALLVLNILTFLLYLLPVAVTNSNIYPITITGVSLIFHVGLPYLLFGIMILATMIYAILRQIINLRNKQYQVDIPLIIIYSVQAILLVVVSFSSKIVYINVFYTLVIFLTLASIIVSLINKTNPNFKKLLKQK